MGVRKKEIKCDETVGGREREEKRIGFQTPAELIHPSSQLPALNCNKRKSSVGTFNTTKALVNTEIEDFICSPCLADDQPHVAFNVI